MEVAESSLDEKILPLSCWIHLQVVNYLWYEIALVVLIGIVLWFVRQRRLQLHEQQLGHKLADQIRHLLKHQHIQASKLDKVSPHIAVTHVRDTLLKPPIDKKKRDRLWDNVS